MKPFGVELWLKKLALAPKTKGHLRNLLPVLFNCAMRWELVDIGENPMKLVRVRGGSNERAVILTRGKALEVPVAELRKTNTDSTTDAVVAGKTRTVRKASSSRPDINSGAAEYERKQRETTLLVRLGSPHADTTGAMIRLNQVRTTPAAAAR
jgi:hypothetical protein